MTTTNTDGTQRKRYRRAAFPETRSAVSLVISRGGTGYWSFLGSLLHRAAIVIGTVATRPASAPAINQFIANSSSLVTLFKYSGRI